MSIRSKALRLALFTLVAALASGCAGGGGGGGGMSSPPVFSPPPPPPPPPPIPVSPIAIVPPGLPAGPQGLAPTQAEFDRGPSLVRVNPIPAWARGVTGRGVTVAVIDSGADLGRFDLSNLSSASSDINAARNDPEDKPDDQDKHGTFVAGIIGADAGNGGIVGIAYGATLLSIRADIPGPCTENGVSTGCPFTASDLTRALDRARLQGASIVNLSLGGDGPLGAGFEAALLRAAQAGMAIVVSAGNSGGASPMFPAAYAADPTYLGAVVAVGALNRDGSIASFSNRAGGVANSYLMAVGERVVTGCFGAAPLQCYGVSGTSFSAPQVAGALALLKEFSPQLSGAQLLQILYASAQDIGPAGIDSQTGRGELNVGAAFQPIGPLSMPIEGGPDAMVGAGMGAVGPAMGDALHRAGALDTIAFDSFGRTFDISLAGAFRSAPARASMAAPALIESQRLSPSVVTRAIVSDTADPLPQSLFEAGLAERPVTAFQAEIALSPRTGLELTRGVSLLNAGGARHAGLAALAGAEIGAALNTRIGGLQVRVGAQGGEASTMLAGGRSVDMARSLAFAEVAAPLGRGHVTARLSGLREEGSLLGLGWTEQLGAAPQGRSGAISLAGEWPITPRIALGVRGEIARISDDGQGFLSASGPLTAASGDLEVRWRPEGSAGLWRLTLSQPLRIEAGELTFNHASATRYGRESLAFQTRTLSAVPEGRETALEIGYGLRRDGFAFDAAISRRFEPGHIAAAPPEDVARLGLSVRLR